MGVVDKKAALVPKKSGGLVKIEDGEIFMEDIKESDLPSIIGGQIEKYKELEKSINEALNRARKAEKSADSARNEPAGFFNRKNAIEAVQESGLENAEAIMALAGSQKISFEFQTKLAEISKFLLMLGLGNIALNRTTVRQLQLRLEGASKEKLSELVKGEIKNVIQQLKTQQDILEKQKNLEESAKELHSRQKTQTVKVEKHEDLIESNTKKIRENARKVKNNSEMLQSLVEEIENHDKKFNAIKRSIKKIDDNISSIEKEVDDIKNLKEYIINKYPKIKFYFLLFCGIIGFTLILSVLSVLMLIIRAK